MKPNTGGQPVAADPHLVVAAADAFKELAKPFLGWIGRDMMTAHGRTARAPGMLVASATNLSLAVELYLKALSIAVGLTPMKCHDLVALYGGLPQWLRVRVAQEYALCEPLSPGVANTLELEISVGSPSRQPDGAKDDSPDWADGSLGAVLKRSKDAFLNWRYLYERGDREGPVVFPYDFANLNNAATAVRATTVSVLDQGR